MAEPTDAFETKARHLRRLYRTRPSWQAMLDEHKRLFPAADVRLDHILASAWKEGRELAGWAYDTAAQCWRRKDGSPVLEDDGREWSHT